MAEPHDHALSLAFMRGHPAHAARVLETLAVADTAALFERVPARLGAAVLGAMLPRRAAACIEALDDVRALELLAPMATQPTVAVLRHLPPPRRRTLVAGLPTASALAASMLLGFTEDTLGAWADPDVVLLPADTRAGDALARMRQVGGAHAVVFVADAARRLSGTVGLQTLLQAPAGATLASLMQRPPAMLQAFAPLSAVAAHPGWELGSMLPVVEPGDRLVGAITRDALARALRQDAPRAAEAPATLPGVLALGYWQALSGLLHGGLGLLPAVPRIAAPAVAPGSPDGR